MEEHFENEARSWIAWARTRDHDAYWYWRGCFFEEIVPEPGHRTLELGCGEGRVARDLTSRGHQVVGCDLSETLLQAAAAAGNQQLVRANGARLPLCDQSVDLVVAYNVLIDVDDLTGVIEEATRVLTRRGILCACLPHPMADVGAFSDGKHDAPFVIEQSYLETAPFAATCTREDLTMTFRGWHRPLGAYTWAMEQTGLVIDRIREPPAPAAALVRWPDHGRWQRIPMFLHLRAQKV
ncbi:MAG TPA: class I SAM-dependent methyltransferase [Acidimicrobiales bacterium]|nr:class I SAM-dependent methyltransferase [Acidimicrobiales bacterium]